MFNISFGEIALITAVGLIIIGPQRLPQTARFVGHLLSRVQRQAATIKADIRREMELEDLKSIHKEYQDAATQVQKTFDAQARELNQAAQTVHQEVNQTVTTKPPPAPNDQVPPSSDAAADPTVIAKDKATPSATDESPAAPHSQSS